MRYFIVDAFTREAFGGNPAGVVLLGQDGKFPSDELMRQVAAELRYSETAFIQQNGPAEYHTLAGDLEVKIGGQVMMQMATGRLVEKTVDSDRLHQIMAGSSSKSFIWPDLPIEIITTGLPDIIMPVSSVEALNALSPDMAALAEFSRELDVVGVHAMTLTDDGYTAHVRNYGPLYGVPEESATGTANAALTHYLSRQGLITAPCDCRFLQGEAMNRPSVVATALHQDGSIWVGGNSCIIAVGDLLGSD